MKRKCLRELQNPDYEHLWLEFHDVTFGDFKSNKFELRIGASMIDPKGFSLLPKFEFPLVDGKHKPFESWFAESGDDFGQKFELRFSLEKQVFDLNTFQRLSLGDQKLIQVLSFVLPTAINKLIKTRVSIHRPWASWSSFVNETVAILLNLTRGLQADSNAKVDQATKKPVDQKSTVPALVQEAVLASTAPGRRQSDLVAAGRRKSDVAAALGVIAEDGETAKQFVPALTKIIKRKSVSVMVAKSTPAQTALKGSQKASAKTAIKKTATKSPIKKIKETERNKKDYQHSDLDTSAEQVGAS